MLEEGRAGAGGGGALGAAGLVRQPVPLGLSQLQGVLRLAHSQELADQQQVCDSTCDVMCSSSYHPWLAAGQGRPPLSIDAFTN